MNTQSSRNNVRFSLSPMYTDQVLMLVILGGACLVIALGVVFVVSRFTDAPSFSWAAVGAIAPWYLAVISGWIMFVMVPIYVAHGRTRQAGFVEWMQTGVLLAVIGAAIMGVGYLIERGFYSLLGLEKGAEDLYFSSSSGSIVMIFAHYVLTFAVWFALGGFVGVSLYRFTDWGWISIPIALATASLTGLWNFTGVSIFGFVRRLVPTVDTGLAIVVVVCLCYLTWRMVQDMSLRNP
ncbi:MAG: hypothetical protein M9953_02190 [Thermomicrobiales bacterium]|nr:hypothetical protein [Thermomicrobiales bacterium]MCO5226957.1 hypothetical protein [Thermomicrobiales bacterium]